MNNTKLKVISGAEPVEVENDGKIIIATGKSRFEKSWKNQKILWSALVKKLGHSLQTRETHAEYMRMGRTSRAKQDNIKDVGGFVGGHIIDGRRLKGSVKERQVITLDADHMAAGESLELKMAEAEIDAAFVVYSTHKHTPENPRERLIIPLARIVTADEYEAVGRWIAGKLDIEIFDDTTFEANRLMYWPSHSADAEPFFYFNDAEFLNPDEVLQAYPNGDWTDTTAWAYSSRVTEISKHDKDRAGDPMEKPGAIGAFNNVYPIREALTTFLSDVYATTDQDDRFTYINGSTAKGLIVYESEGFVYSHHGTDPAGSQLCNAFDIVRIHKFGHLDEDADPTKGVTRMPSYKAMTDFALQDPKVATWLADRQAKKAAEDFRDLQEDEDWRARLERDKKGDIKPNATNAKLILTYDERLREIRYNELSGVAEAPAGSLPWKHNIKYWMNSDTDQLYIWVATEYGVQFPNELFMKALTVATHGRGFHPIKEYLESLPEWDGVDRIDTLLTDYFGAESSQYVMEATRRWLTAAVARVYQPGIKFDNMLVLNGPQGIGKSTLFYKLAGEWFSDNLTMINMRDETGMERLQGYWILEISEMAGMRKADIESVKSFISKREDSWRPAYGRWTERHPRQCVLAGSTNSETGFLRDVTGNRRFWPIKINGQGPKKVWDMTDEEVGQIWAEACMLYELGEPLILSEEAEAAAEDAQREAMEEDPRQGLVEEYLETLLPEGWDDMSIDGRLLFLEGDSDLEGTERRETVSIIEIWTECLKKCDRDITARDREELKSIMVRLPGWSDSAEYRKRLKPYKNQQVRAYTRRVKKHDKGVIL